jgi:hypothetical protein
MMTMTMMMMMLMLLLLLLLLLTASTSLRMRQMKDVPAEFDLGGPLISVDLALNFITEISYRISFLSSVTTLNLSKNNIRRLHPALGDLYAHIALAPVCFCKHSTPDIHWPASTSPSMRA